MNGQRSERSSSSTVRPPHTCECRCYLCTYMAEFAACTRRGRMTAGVPSWELPIECSSKNVSRACRTRRHKAESRRFCSKRRVDNDMNIAQVTCGAQPGCDGVFGVCSSPSGEYGPPGGSNAASFPTERPCLNGDEHTSTLVHNQEVSAPGPGTY